MGTKVAVIGVVKFRDKVLLLKRTPFSSTSPNKWQVVSGKIKKIETAEECVLREVKEETGLKGRIKVSGKVFECFDRWGRWAIIPFLVSVGSDEVKTNPKEHTTHAWVRPENYKKFDCVDGTKEDLESVGVL